MEPAHNSPEIEECILVCESGDLNNIAEDDDSAIDGDDTDVDLQMRRLIEREIELYMNIKERYPRIQKFIETIVSRLQLRLEALEKKECNSTNHIIHNVTARNEVVSSTFDSPEHMQQLNFDVSESVNKCSPVASTVAETPQEKTEFPPSLEKPSSDGFGSRLIQFFGPKIKRVRLEVNEDIHELNSNSNTSMSTQSHSCSDDFSSDGKPDVAPIPLGTETTSYQSADGRKGAYAYLVSVANLGRSEASDERSAEGLYGEYCHCKSEVSVLSDERSVESGEIGEFYCGDRNQDERSVGSHFVDDEHSVQSGASQASEEHPPKEAKTMGVVEGIKSRVCQWISSALSSAK